MNIRSLTRGDGVVIGAAVLLLIASFLDIYSFEGAPDSADIPSLWGSGPVVLGVVLAGIIGAALVVVARAMPQPLKVAGLDLGQFGIAFTVFAAWCALGNIFDPAGAFDNDGGVSGLSAGTGLILALVATLLMAAAAVATPLLPALKGSLIPASRPAAPQPYGGQPQGGYGYPGAQQQPYGAQPGQPGQPGPFGGQPQPGQPQPGQPQPGQPQAPQPHAPQQAQAQPAGDFSPFWFAVPVPRPLFAEDGSPTPIAELAPGTWYLAVEQRGANLVAQTQDGRRGVLQDTSGIQRG
ncbi:Integral membrane protein OS=Streptomyces tendae OX=1932 GN=GUR47_10895 PE=4 SV=1 [Streptomyces tendae]